jgi:hypothetical protein
MTTDRYIWGLSEISSEALGKLVKLVKVESVETISAYRLRVRFDRAMNKNNALVNTAYYTITPTSPGGVTPYISEVLLPDVVYPTYVDLITSEMTGGLNYEVEVSPSGPTATNNLRVDEYYNMKTFVSIAINPTIKHVEVISDTRIDVVFTENMKYNSSIIDKERYSIDNGLSILSVLEMDVDRVKLVTTQQIPGVLYTLTIA